MPLDEVQKQHRLIDSQNDLIRQLESRPAEVESRVK